MYLQASDVTLDHEVTPYILLDESPLRKIRTSLGLTQVNLAARAGISRMVVIRTEQGMYSSIPDKILTQLSAVAGYPIFRRDVQPLYESWQRDQRILQDWVNNPFVTQAEGIAAFRGWRTTVSPIKSAMGFCRLLCIHPNSLRALETGTSRTFPSQISAALLMAGIEDERLDYLYSLTPEGLSDYASGF